MAWLNGCPSCRARRRAWDAPVECRVRTTEAPERVRLPGPGEDLVVQALRFLEALELARVGLADEAFDVVAGLLEAAHLEPDPRQHGERRPGRLRALGLAQDADHLVRDQRGFLEPALDDVAGLHPVEDLRALRGRSHAVAQGEGAVEHAAQLRGRPPHRHPIARGEDELEVELPAVAPCARGQLLKQRQAAAGEGLRLVVGVDALGDDRRPRVVGDRLLEEPGALVVRGDLGADGIEVLLVRRDQGLGHAPVQPAPLRGARLGVGHVAQLVVGEVVRVRPLLAHDALAPQLVERARDHLLVAHQAHEDLQVEGAPDHGRGRRRLPGVVRELGQAAGDHRVRAGRELGDPVLRDPRGRSGPALGPHRLHDEEGVALGRPIEPGGRVRVEDPVPDLGRQLRRLRRVQGLEGDLGELRSAPQVPEERRERVRGVELLRTRGPEDEQARVGIEPGEEMEPLEGLAVAPLQVVDEEEQGRRSREHRPGQALEEAQPVAELRHGRGPRQVRLGGQQLGQDPRDLDPPHVLETGDVRREGVAAQPLAHGGEGEPAFRGVGARPGRGHSLALGPGQQLLRQPRLADAGVARHERERGSSAGGPLPGLPQPRPLDLPAHEGCRGGGPPPAPRGATGGRARRRGSARTCGRSPGSAPRPAPGEARLCTGDTPGSRPPDRRGARAAA